MHAVDQYCTQWRAHTECSLFDSSTYAASVRFCDQPSACNLDVSSAPDVRLDLVAGIISTSQPNIFATSRSEYTSFAQIAYSSFEPFSPIAMSPLIVSSTCVNARVCVPGAFTGHFLPAKAHCLKTSITVPY